MENMPELEHLLNFYKSHSRTRRLGLFYAKAQAELYAKTQISSSSFRLSPPMVGNTFSAGCHGTTTGTCICSLL